MILLIVLAACGGDGGGVGDPGAGSDAAEDGAADPAGEGVIDVQPPGQGVASVDGLEYTLQASPDDDCSISEESLTLAFWVEDESVGLGGGANLYEDGWLGTIDLLVLEPEGEPGPISYFPDLEANADGVVIDGDSFSYSGPMLKQPANDGSNPPPVDVGEGTFSVTCP
jgi:hypothetical protein